MSHFWYPLLWNLSYVTIQSHGFSADARTHYVTANGVRNGLSPEEKGADSLEERADLFMRTH